MFTELRDVRSARHVRSQLMLRPAVLIYTKYHVCVFIYIYIYIYIYKLKKLNSVAC
jgi:hypothetical protein